jgi:hypothetical protein
MAETKNSPPGPFQPYVNTINENDPLMKRVPFPSMDIGANAASIPSGLIGRVPGIEHTGKSPTKA